MAKSYYAILGLSSMATADEIRSAYRRLVKAYHPDHYSGDSRIFRQVQEAYTVLGNAERRRQYENQLRRSTPRPPSGPQGFPGPEPLIPTKAPYRTQTSPPVRSVDRFAPSRDRLFDWLWSNFSTLMPLPVGRPRTIALKIPISRTQMQRGGTITVMVPVRARCPVCLGDGGVGPYECHHCAGEGALSGEIPVAIAFPPHFSEGFRVHLSLDRFGLPNHRLTVDLVVDDPPAVDPLA